MVARSAASASASRIRDAPGSPTRKTAPPTGPKERFPIPRYSGEPPVGVDVHQMDDGGDWHGAMHPARHARVP